LGVWKKSSTFAPAFRRNRWWEDRSVARYVAQERYNNLIIKYLKMDLIKVAEEAFATGNRA
jgi:hypothetical protein